MSDLGFSERARRSIVLAQTIAARRDNIYIGAEDLLMGILTEGENPAAKWLYSQGITISDFEDFLGEGSQRGSTYPS